MSNLKHLIAAAAAMAAAASPYPPVGATPMLGWNSWNHFGCSVNETILRDMAQAMVSTGLKDAGYMYINSDDCWMNPTRDANGHWVPNPDKFPSGLPATVAYINGLGLKMGLYTARSQHTCAGFAGSCGYEATDAAWLASMGIEYLKDDNCGGCSDYLTDYGKMQQGIWATGKAIVLTVEGDPSVVNMTQGGFGNAKRVGHDITPSWKSAISLVDIGSGLWPYAHGLTNTSTSSFWTDLDMIEIGNGEFSTTAYPAGSNTSLILSQAHFSLWCIMKAVMLLGNDLTQLDAQTLAIISNKEALAVNQDALGVQGRRVAVAMPRNNTLGVTQWDSVGVIAKCDASRPTQTWVWKNTTAPSNNLLYLQPCATGNAMQQWTFPGGSGGAWSTLQNKGTGQCVDAAAQFDPGMLLPCNTQSGSQQWVWNSSTGHLYSNSPQHCLDVYNFAGPDVEMGSCKIPGQNDQNQQFIWNAATGQITANTTGGAHGWCLAAAAGPSGGQLTTTDANGVTWCLDGSGSSEGGWSAAPCGGNGARGQTFSYLPVNGQPGNFSWNGAIPLGYNGQFGASGPWPHSRYLVNYGGPIWTMNEQALLSTGTQIQAASNNIIDDDLIGNVTASGGFCLDVTTMGMLETWVGPLSGGRFAVVLFNRSPADDTITLNWADMGVAPTAAFAVRDIWAAADRGVRMGAYSAMVPAHGVAFLVLTPQ